MAKEIFDGARMASTLRNLESYYNSFYSAMQNMDLAVNTNLAVTSASAAYGDKAKKVLDLWNENCSVFKNYYYVFKELSSLVVKVFENNAEFESSYQFDEETKISYGEITVGELNAMTLANARIIAALMSGSLMFDGKPISGDVLADGTEKIVIGSEEFIITKDENGNLISIKNVNTGEVKNFKPGSIENYIQNMYDLYLEGKITQEDWDLYCSELTTEERGFLDCLMTNAFVAESTEVVSVVGEVNDEHYLPLITETHDGKYILENLGHLNDVILYEQGILSSYSSMLLASRAMHESMYNEGYITDETFDAILNDIDTQIEFLDSQITARGHLYNDLLDSGNGNTYDLINEAIKNGDFDLVNKLITEFNQGTTSVLPLSDLLCENSIFGENIVCDLNQNSWEFEKFGNYSSIASVDSCTSIKNVTFMGAYDYAQSTNQTYTSVDNPDLVYFSSGDYINTIVENGNYMPEAAYTYTYRHVSGFRNELEYLKSCESNALTFDSVPDVMMDSVYIKSLDAFCTVNQFNTYLENGVLVKNEDGTISLGEI